MTHKSKPMFSEARDSDCNHLTFVSMCVTFFRLESNVVHRYTNVGTFVVAAECTSSEMHIKAQKIITVQERAIKIGVIRCHAGKKSFYESNCRALYGAAFQIQMEVKAGLYTDELNLKYVIPQV